VWESSFCHPACLNMARLTKATGLHRLISYNSFNSYAKGALVPGGCVAIDTDTLTDTESLLEWFRRYGNTEVIDLTGAPGRN
jgi:hypothetical protein